MTNNIIDLDDKQIQKLHLLIRQELTQIAIRRYDAENVIEYYKEEMRKKKEQDNELDPIKIRLVEETAAVVKWLDIEMEMLQDAQNKLVVSS